MAAYINQNPVAMWQKPVEPLEDWETKVVDAVSHFMAMWGFSQDDWKPWALLYLRDEAMPVSEIHEMLSLTEESIVESLDMLVDAGVIHRMRVSGRSCLHYRAEVELMTIVSRVLGYRKSMVVSCIKDELGPAIQAAKESGWAFEGELERLERVMMLASLTEKILSVLSRAPQWSMNGAHQILRMVQMWLERDSD